MHQVAVEEVILVRGADFRHLDESGGAGGERGGARGVCHAEQEGGRDSAAGTHSGETTAGTDGP